MIRLELCGAVCPLSIDTISRVTKKVLQHFVIGIIIKVVSIKLKMILRVTLIEVFRIVKKVQIFLSLGLGGWEVGIMVTHQEGVQPIPKTKVEHGLERGACGGVWT